MKQVNNKILLIEIFIIITGGLFLSSINGYEIYTIGYSIILTIIGICFIFIIFITYKKLLYNQRDFRKEIEEYFGKDIEGKRPKLKDTEAKEIPFPL